MSADRTQPVSVNFRAIAEIRQGVTGAELARFEIASCTRCVASFGPKNDPLGAANFEIGALRDSLRKVCNLLALAVEDPDSDVSEATQEDIDDASVAQWSATLHLRQLQAQVTAIGNARAAAGREVDVSTLEK